MKEFIEQINNFKYDSESEDLITRLNLIAEDDSEYNNEVQQLVGPKWERLFKQKLLELKNNLLNTIMKRSFNFGLSKIADAFEKRALELYK